MSLLLGFKDTQITFYFGLATIFHFASTFIVAHIWDKFGEIYTMGFSILSQNLLFCLILLSQLNNDLFLWTIILVRFNGSQLIMNYQLINFGIFGKQGMQFAMYNQISSLLSEVLGYLMMKFLFSEQHVFRQFNFCSILVVAQIVYYFLYIKKAEERAI